MRAPILFAEPFVADVNLLDEFARGHQIRNVDGNPRTTDATHAPLCPRTSVQVAHDSLETGTRAQPAGRNQILVEEHDDFAV